MNTWLAVAATAAAAASGAPSLWPRRGDGGRRAASAIQVFAAVLAALAAVRVLLLGRDADLQLAASPLLPQLTFGLDALSAVFVLPVCLLCACAAVYDLGYWRHGAHAPAGRRVPACSGLLFAGLLGVQLARDGVAFLIAWEVMALAAFLLVATEHRRAEVRAASWIYLAATHASTLLLIAFFCCWQAATGSLQLEPAAAGSIAPAQRDLLFALALVGFGLKAGVVPLHFWLPPAHAAAPSHVSAVMSGVLIKAGVYGVARTGLLLPEPPAGWGQILLGVGATSAVVGVAFAIGQHDLKRLLAYHSIENIGIIFLGLGTAFLGRATGQRELIALGLAGALLHTWNHGLFKGLLFFAAGAVIQRTGTREIDQLGGLARRMPRTAAAFLCGAVAICGLPPLNGFVSELLTYLGLFAALRGDAAAACSAAAIPALALTSAMALLCFVKVFGIVFLGAPRSAGAGDAREAGRALLLPMAALALGCVLIGLLPLAAAPLLQPAIDDWLPAGGAGAALASTAPLAAISVLAPLLAAAGLLLWLQLRRRSAAAGAAGTWDCGYLRTTPTMQYTAASFAQLFVECSRRLLLPRTRKLAPTGLFPPASNFFTHVPDLVLDRLLLPLLALLGSVCSWLRLLHRGYVQVYLLYVFLALLVLLLLR